MDTTIARLRADEAVSTLDTDQLLAFNDRLADAADLGELHLLADTLIRQLEACRDGRQTAEEERAEAIRSAAAAIQREQGWVDRCHRAAAILGSDA